MQPAIKIKHAVVRVAAKRLRFLIEYLDDAGDTEAALLPQPRRAMFVLAADQAWSLARRVKDQGDPGVCRRPSPRT
jgi:hypothetical protein